MSWVFFDLGNTLIDESAPIADRIRVITETLRAKGHEVSPDDLDEALTQALTEFAPRVITRAFELLGVDVTLEDSFASVIYRKELETPYPDTPSTIGRLADSFSLGVVANQSAGTRGRLESYGLLQHFSVVISSTEEGLEKPDPEIFRLAVSRAGCEPEDAVMVGDRLDNDIAPAKALGFKTIRVLRGYARFQRPRSADEEPDYTVTRLDEIPVLLGMG